MSGVSGTPRLAPTDSSFLSIDDILASEQRIPCKFEQAIVGLGFIDQASDEDDIREGAKLELPLWLAAALKSRRQAIVSVELPKQYRQSYRDVLTADANVVDLHKLGPYYYGCGTMLLMFDHPERGAVSKSLLETFLNRFRRIMDTAQNAFDEDTSGLTEKLDNIEKELFAAGQLGIQYFSQWERLESRKLETATTVLSHRKRKRSQID
jgi:GINS complex subunit 3